MKYCIFCKAELHEAASFCHACGHSQIEKKRAKMPSPWKKQALLLTLVLMLGVTSIFLLRNEPKEEPENSPPEEPAYVAPLAIENQSKEELHYQTADGERYHLRLSFSKDGEAQATRTKAIAEDQGKDGSFPSLLYISKESSGEFVQQGFLNEFVKDVTIESLPQNGTQPLDLEKPYYDPLEFPEAVLKSDMRIGSYNAGDNIVRWTLTMKNGDVLVLEQTVTIELMEVLKYSWNDVSLNTIDELNRFLEELDQTTSRDQVVEVYLPPVTYEGALELYGRSYRLYGSYSEDGAMTTFLKPSISKTQGRGKMELFDIFFKGDGGTGLSCQETLFLENCIFEGWDVAVHIQDGAWSQSDACTYRRNGIGMLFDCKDDGSFGPNYDDNIFEENQIGVQIKAVHTKRTISFDDCLFRNNEIDIDNQFGQDLDLTSSTFRP